MSHIESLLITFFYHHMPGLIENGRLYVGEPPLYKVDLGKSAKKKLFLKDEKAYAAFISKRMRDYFESSGYSLAKGVGLDKLISSIEKLIAKGYPETIEKVARELIGSPQSIALLVERGTKAVASRFPEIWNEEKSLLRGMAEGEFHNITVGSKQYSRSIARIGELKDIPLLKNPLGKPASMYEVIRLLEKAAKPKGLQRLKGLGETNPDELGETTISPQTRRITKVTIKKAEEALKWLDILMGDDPDKRKNFLSELRGAIDEKEIDLT